MNRKTWILLVMAIVLLFSACSQEHYESFYDDDENIAQVDHYSVLFSSNNKLAYGSYSYSASSLNGAITLCSFPVSEKEMTLTCALTTTEGKAKLVLIAPDKTVTTLVEATEETEEIQNRFLIQAEALIGQYSIKVVGMDKAKVVASIYLSQE